MGRKHGIMIMITIETSKVYNLSGSSATKCLCIFFDDKQIVEIKCFQNCIKLKINRWWNFAWGLCEGGGGELILNLPLLSIRWLSVEITHSHADCLNLFKYCVFEHKYFNCAVFTFDYVLISQCRNLLLAFVFERAGSWEIIETNAQKINELSI